MNQHTAALALIMACLCPPCSAVWKHHLGSSTEALDGSQETGGFLSSQCESDNEDKPEEKPEEKPEAEPEEKPEDKPEEKPKDEPECTESQLPNVYDDLNNEIMFQNTIQRAWLQGQASGLKRGRSEGNLCHDKAQQEGEGRDAKRSRSI